MDRGRGRDQGFHRPNRGRSGGRQVSRFAGQPPRLHNPERGRSSDGRSGRSMNVEKRQKGQSSSETMTDVSLEANSPVVYDVAREETSSAPLSGPPVSSLCMSEERAQIGQNFNVVTTNNVSLNFDLSIKMDISIKHTETSSRPFSCGDKGFRPSLMKGLETPASGGKSMNSEQSAAFDICLPPKTSVVKLKPSLFDMNRGRRSEMQRSTEVEKAIVLRPGMVLLKSYIPLSDQVKIVKRCRDLGLGPGGFYQPGYRDGAKLHLNMMCLGKNWDPQTSSYGDHRPHDGAEPPAIPDMFYQLVEKAIKDSHSAVQKENKADNAEKILPRMTPNICLANFYSANGRLGLHQDRDESSDSIRKGLPVVSFSIGDAAEFLYGDQRDVDKADKVVLESGDVLIFGGHSRNIFHGVTAIHPDTAPKTLLEQANLRPGRLNLTFRQY